MEFLNGLNVVVYVMLIVVLYHVIFLAVDLRKIMRRIEGITEELEAVILKPLSMTDKAFKWMMHHMEEGETSLKRGARKKKK